MMNCGKSVEIAAYLKGEAPEGERETLRLHFESCAACTADLAKFDRVLKALGKMEGVEPSPGFRWRVREAFLRAHPEFLEAPARSPLSVWASFRQSFGFVPAWAFSIAAHVLLIALAAILIFTPRSPEEELRDLAIRSKPRRLVDEAPRFPEAGGPFIPDRRGAGGAGESPTEDFQGPRNPGESPSIRPRPVRDPKLEKLDITRWMERLPKEPRLLAFFESRSDKAQRKALRGKYGGAEVQEAVLRALAWLAREQKEDGRWTAPALRGDETESPYTVGLTGLALLAFLGEGHGPKSGEYGAIVRRGLDFLMAAQLASGQVGDERGNYMYNHAIGALAILEAGMMTRDKAMLAAAEAAVAFTIAAQNETGGWGYFSRAPENDTSVAGWQVLLLRLAKLNGSSGVVPALVQAHERLRRATDSEGRVGYHARLQFPNGPAGLTAVGMLAHLMSTHTPDAELLARQSELLLAGNPLPDEGAGSPRNDLYHAFFGTLAVHQHGEKWRPWYGQICRGLQQSQRPDGSWPAQFDRWHTYGGAVYTTALAALVLETPLRYPRLFE